MICAIELLAMAHQWRKHFAPMIRMRLRINPWRKCRAIGFFPTAHQWRNGGAGGSFLHDKTGD